MKVVRLLPVFCLSATLFAQPPAPIHRSTKSFKTPKVRNAQAYAILPQIADGDVWTTQVVLVNLSPNTTEPYEVDLYDQNGNSAQVNFVLSGTPTMVSKLTGTLAPGQTVTYSTADLSPVEQDTWGSIQNSNTGIDVSAYEVIQDKEPFGGPYTYFAETEINCDYGLDNTATNPGGFLPFDNTNGAVTALALVNPDITNATGGDTTLLVNVLDSNGTSLATHTVTLTGGQKSSFLIQNQWPETRGITGTLYVLPNSLTFSAITMFGLRSYNTGNYKTLSTINLLQPTVDSTVP